MNTKFFAIFMSIFCIGAPVIEAANASACVIERLPLYSHDALVAELITRKESPFSGPFTTDAALSATTTGNQLVLIEEAMVVIKALDKMLESSEIKEKTSLQLTLFSLLEVVQSLRKRAVVYVNGPCFSVYSENYNYSEDTQKTYRNYPITLAEKLTERRLQAVLKGIKQVEESFFSQALA